MTLLYLSRVPTLVQHGVLAARAFASDVTTEADRAQAMGRTGLAYGLAMACAPILGGKIAKSYSLYLPSWIGSALTAGNLAIIVYLIVEPRTTHSPARAAPDSQAEELASLIATAPGAESPPSSVPVMPPSPTALAQAAAPSICKHLNLAKIKLLLRADDVRDLLLAKLLYYCSSSIFTSVFMLAAIDRFGMAADSLGFLLAFVGICFGVSQGFLTSYVTAYWSDLVLNRATNVVMFGCYLLVAVITSTFWLYAVLAPLLCASAIYSVVNMAQLTKRCADTDYGSILALEMILGSATRLVSTALAGAILTSPLGWPGVCTVCAVIKLFAVALFFTNRLYH